MERAELYKKEQQRFTELENAEERVWIEFLFQLTIVGRGNAQEELRQINEINHRVLNRVRDIASDQPWFSIADTFQMIGMHVRSAPGLEEPVRHALRAALEKASPE